jgi:hypothetical protein
VHSRLTRPTRHTRTSIPQPQAGMPQPTPQQKHDILVHCQSRRAGQSVTGIAAAHGVTVGRTTIWNNWQQGWDGTPHSLEHKSGAGRPRMRTLTPLEASRHVHAPILAANHAHKAMSYATLLPSMRLKTRKQVTLRTLQVRSNSKSSPRPHVSVLGTRVQTPTQRHEQDHRSRRDCTTYTSD